jgi:Zn-finger nucleic acid-binding protein
VAQQKNNNHYYKCPHCTCIFFSETDLQKHLTRFGSNREQHEYEYKKVHGRLEHGYGEE